MNRRMFTKLVSALSMIMLVQIAPLGFADEPIYGYQLMTEQERAEHRAKMQSFQTEQEREAYRQEHHKMMQERAKAQGVTLPDEPMPRGQGRGMGPGMGAGQGMGQGMGPGMDQGKGQGQGQGAQSDK
ncbi:hypothetical protein [Kaarinaea lacus]